MNVETQPAPAAAVYATRFEQVDRLGDAIRRASLHLLDLQAAEGYWVGELEADTTLESDYVLFQLWMDPPSSHGGWLPKEAAKIREAARYIRERQTASGGWNIYPGGPDNLSACVKAYFALKLAGDSSEAPHMQAARERILELGGIERSNSYTRIYLSFFGLYDRAKIPTIPPEIMLLSPSAYINIYEMSSWSRAILAPLSILCAVRPQRPVPAGFHLDELYCGADESPRASGWAKAFWTLDRILKIWERSGFLPHRKKAIRVAERWILERMEASDGLAAIYPSMLNSILALTELGYSTDHPVVRRAIRQFEDLAIREDGTLRMQPCFSPVWDTALAAYALGVGQRSLVGRPPRTARGPLAPPAEFWKPLQAGHGTGCSSEGPPHPSAPRALSQAAEWLLTKEVRRKGDWAVKNRLAEPGGWYFEFANEFYADIDDTAMVLLALEHCRASDIQAQRAAERRAVNWILSMQSKDGGFAAFDKDNDRWILTQVPFADHNAMLDPTCADVTGRVLEALSASEFAGPHHPAARRAVDYLRNVQEPDGSWMGRWGVNYIYGTCFALRGLRAAGVNPREARIIQAGEWIRSVQNADGGWGESCGSYDDPSRKGAGPSTASQTAWALMALFASGDYSSGSVRRGVSYLLDAQKPDGGWEEHWFTGTGFPKVFYLKYHLYAQYFPLMALAESASRDSGEA